MPKKTAYADMDTLIKSADKLPNAKYRRERLRVWSKFLDTLHESDYPAALEVLRFQLTWTRKTIYRNRVIQAYRQVAKEIKVIEELLEHVIGDSYHKKVHYEPLVKQYEKKYGKQRMTFEPIKDSSGSRIVFKFGKHNQDDLPGVREALVKARQKAEKAQQADLEKACKLLAAKVAWWWD